MINRFITNDLINTILNFPVVGIIGPRQSGKTTIAKYIITKLNKAAIYLDIENPKDENKLSDPVLFFENNQDKCIILDEIQHRPDLFPILRAMIDLNRVPARFIILGSASPELINKSSESLAGRIAYKELFPLNFMEVNSIYSIYTHWFKGGFPDSLQTTDNNIHTQWCQNFVRTYIERDLPLLGLNLPSKTIFNLWTMLSSMNGNVINKSNLTKSLEINAVTLNKYLSFMEHSFLITQLQSWEANVKKRLVKSSKIYIRDSGILHYLSNIFSIEDLLQHHSVGSSWEGYVIEQIIQLLPTYLQPYFYRTHDGSECDLVIVKSGKPMAAIEIKYTSTPKITKSITISIQDLQTKLNFIITPASDDYLIKENIRVCSLNTFLEKYFKELE